MPKVRGPLFSVLARGSLGEILTYQGRPGGAAVYPYSKPGSRVKKHALPSASQALIRGYYREAVEHWQILSEAEKQQWNDFVKGL